MACEDFPACGHEAGCCPDFDESGEQLNMICTCGAKLPVDNRVSICDACLRHHSDFGEDRYDDADNYGDFDDEFDDFDNDEGWDEDTR